VLAGAGIGALMAGALLVFGVRGSFLAAPIVGGGVLAAAVRRLALPRWLPAVVAALGIPALPAAQLAYLRVLVRRVPVPPGAERLAHRAGLAGWENGPFGQLEIRTTAGFEEVVAFYRAELSSRGWRSVHCITSSDRSFYRFAKRRSALLVVIWESPSDQSRRVQVTYEHPASGPPGLDSPDCIPVRAVPI
jgi:hypothetical protein